MSYVACSLFLFFKDINQHKKKDGFVAFKKKQKKNFAFIIDNIVSFYNHCLTCSD